MSFPRYPSYKDSGVEWLGNVPEGWDVVPLKSAAFVAVSGIDKKSKDDEKRIRFLGTDTVYSSERITTAIELEECSASDEQIRCFSLLPEDVVITKDSVVPTKIAVVSYVDQSPEQAVCGYHLALVRSYPKRAVGLFLFYALKSTALAAYFLSEARGTTIIGIGGGVIGKAAIPLPTLPEQTAVAEFLDRETTKIDELVAEQRRLVELLKEKRQAVISHAVTQGLNPHAPMKPSGIEWLGDVPAHWEVSRIKRICYINDGNHGEEYPSAEDYTDEQDGVPFIRAGNISGLSITSQDMLYITQEKNTSMRKGRLQAGDILFTNRGEIGKIAVIPPKYEGANLNSQIAYFRTDESFVVSKYFAHYLTSDVVFSVYDSVSAGSVLTQFPIGDLRNIPAILPPIAEQTAIAIFLDTESAKFDTLTAEAQRAIDLLQERRTALISAAVTGQIDVRQLSQTQKVGAGGTEIRSGESSAA